MLNAHIITLSIHKFHIVECSSLIMPCYSSWHFNLSTLVANDVDIVAHSSWQLIGGVRSQFHNCTVGSEFCCKFSIVGNYQCIFNKVIVVGIAESRVDFHIHICGSSKQVTIDIGTVVALQWHIGESAVYGSYAIGNLPLYIHHGLSFLTHEQIVHAQIFVTLLWERFTGRNGVEVASHFCLTAHFTSEQVESVGNATNLHLSFCISFFEASFNSLVHILCTHVELSKRTVELYRILNFCTGSIFIAAAECVERFIIGLHAFVVHCHLASFVDGVRCFGISCPEHYFILLAGDKRKLHISAQIDCLLTCWNCGNTIVVFIKNHVFQHGCSFSISKSLLGSLIWACANTVRQLHFK